MRAVSVVLLMLLSILSGCATTTGPEAAGADEPAAPTPVTPANATSYLHDVSQRLPGVSFETAIVEQYLTAVDELVELDTWIARPDVDEPVPVILEVTPYYTGGEPTGFGRRAVELLERGYAIGVSSVRGTGNSGGCFTQGGPEEARDTAAVIEDIASQPWSNGNVGLMGVSYPGTTPQDVWVEAPPSLKTIIPISGISDLYKYNFVNAVHINPQGYAFNTYYWVLEGPPTTNPADTDTVPGAVAGEVCEDQVWVQEGGASSALDGNKDEYWQVRDFLAEYEAAPDRERASVFYIHGLQDWNVKPHMMEDWLPAIQDSGVPYKVWLGQWPHAWPAPSSTDAVCEAPDEDGSGGACRADWWSEVMVAWFDRFLKEKDTGILDMPAVQVQDDDKRWRHETRWPPTDVENVRLHPDADGTLDPSPGSGSVTYHDGNGGLVQPSEYLPDAAPDRAVFRSEPLDEDWHVSGMPVFHGNVTASGSRASLIMTLAEELPDGTLRSINFGAQSLNHVDSLEAGALDISGVRQEVHVRFFPQDDVIHAGSRVVLLFAGNTVGSPGPSFTPASSGSDITVDLEGAWFELPLDRTLVFEDPQPYDKAE